MLKVDKHKILKLCDSEPLQVQAHSHLDGVWSLHTNATSMFGTHNHILIPILCFRNTYLLACDYSSGGDSAVLL
jgi:hypothetical protein